MQNNVQTSGARTPVPDIGPNKLQQALDDYENMVDELGSVKANLAQHVELNNKLIAENEAIKEQMKVQVQFLTRQIDMLTTQRDRFAILLKGLTTRYRVIRECFAQCEKDALAEGIDLNETTASKDDGSTPEQQRALKDLALDDPRRRFDAPAAARALNLR